jgi:hypothetical protein
MIAARHGLAAVAGLLIMLPTMAQAPSSLKGIDDPLPDYPTGSIKSLEASQAAEQAANAALKKQEQVYAQRRKSCYKDFFAERCLSKARDEDYQIRARIGAVQLEARDFRRHEDADKALKSRTDREAKRQADAQKDEAEREQKTTAYGKKVQRNQNENADFEAKAGDRAKAAADNRKREADRSAELRRKRDEEQARAPERAERAKERQAQVDEYLRRAEEREKRQKEKEKGRQEAKQKQAQPG